VIAEAYVKVGGPVTLHPMTIGKQEQNGHHVTIENPGEITDFIIKAAVK
jgi:sialidase-1